MIGCWLTRNNGKWTLPLPIEVAVLRHFNFIVVITAAAVAKKDGAKVDAFARHAAEVDNGVVFITVMRNGDGVRTLLPLHRRPQSHLLLAHVFESEVASAGTNGDIVVMEKKMSIRPRQMNNTRNEKKRIEI